VRPRPTSAAAATDESYALAEGPRWDARRRRLHWVDIDAGLVLDAALAGRRIVDVRARQVAETVGAVTPADDGSLLVAAHDRLVVLRDDRILAEGAPLLPGSSGRRFNDGAVDPAGRFLIGTLARSGGSTTEQLLRLEHDGTVTVLDEDLGLSNGLAWSPDGSRFYSVDTERRYICVRDYDVSTGHTGPRAVWAAVADGLPDGIAVDAAGHVWVAVWGAGEVHRMSPDGVVVDVVAVPAPYTSAVAFAGDDLDVLVVTTARSGLTPAQVDQHAMSGHLFTARVEVPGLPGTPWRRGPLNAPGSIT
jgi:sugar lactone lactonase YvrE